MPNHYDIAKLISFAFIRLSILHFDKSFLYVHISLPSVERWWWSIETESFRLIDCARGELSSECISWEYFISERKKELFCNWSWDLRAKAYYVHFWKRLLDCNIKRLQLDDLLTNRKRIIQGNSSSNKKSHAMSIKKSLNIIFFLSFRWHILQSLSSKQLILRGERQLLKWTVKVMKKTSKFCKRNSLTNFFKRF